MRGDQQSGFDVAVVGAGIIGLAHALAAAKAGKRVVVIDRDPLARLGCGEGVGEADDPGADDGDVEA